MLFNPAGSLQIEWQKPYNILMDSRAVRNAIEIDRIEGSEEKVSDSTSLENLKDTKVGKTLLDVQQMQVDFKLWLASR